MTIVNSLKNFTYHSTDYDAYCQNPNVNGKSITWKDFIPVNSWKVDLQGDRIERAGEEPIYCHITDGYRSYYNHQPDRIELAVTALISDPIRVLIKLVAKVLSIVTLFPLWQQREPRSLLNRVSDYLWNFVDIPMQILFFAAKELSSIYGVITPFNGQKLYASFERLAWNLGFGVGIPSNRGLLMMSFQPDLPFDHHLFNGRHESCNNACHFANTFITGFAPFDYKPSFRPKTALEVI